MFPDAAVDHIIEAEEDADIRALQRLRLARRNNLKREREHERAERRLFKARKRLFAALDDVEARGLDQLDPRSIDA